MLPDVAICCIAEVIYLDARVIMLWDVTGCTERILSSVIS